MIKDLMTLPLLVDTPTIKATGDAFYTATENELNAYTIGYIPWEMVEKSVLFSGIRRGTLSNNPANVLSYTAAQTFNASRGVPFCYSFAQSANTPSCNVYNNGENYVNLPWGVTTTTGILHSFNTSEIVALSPQTIQKTVGIFARFRMFVVYLPEGSTGGWSSTAGENGWVTALAEKTATLNPLTLAFSVTSNTDGSYMPTPVTFTLDDLQNAGANGVMVKQNGTTSYAGITYNIFVHCIISNAYLYEISAGQIKNGVVSYDNMRYSGLGDIDTPFFNTVASGYSRNDVFACNAIPDIETEYGGTNGYYIETSDSSYELLRSGNNLNNLISGGFTELDLKILRSVARPIYKIDVDNVEKFYVAEFNDDFTITGELIEFANARDWQKNINPDSNTFDYNDIPEPGGGDAENVGDSVVLPSVFGVGTTNGFVTQYALRKSDIQQLGALLWTSFVDADYWQNYLFSLALDTGTFSLAGLMSFFVSLKVYPFPLVNVSGLVSEGGNDMYVGTGIVPLHFTNKLHSLTSYVDKIDGGSAVIDSKYFYHDWRDYVNTEIILYVPYCGTIHLNPADVVGNTVRIRYVIDFSTGGCVAYVMCITTGEKSFMIGALPGQIGADVPLSATAAGEIAARFIGDAMNAGHLVGGEVGNIAGGIASGLSGNTPGAGGGNVLSGIAGVYGGLPAAMGADLAPGVASQALSMLTRSAVSAPLMSGGRGFASFGAPQIPYIQIRRGIYPEISKLSEINGKPSAGTYKVGDLSGFVSGVVKTDGINAHENEKAKIRRLIAGGIYV